MMTLREPVGQVTFLLLRKLVFVHFLDGWPALPIDWSQPRRANLPVTPARHCPARYSLGLVARTRNPLDSP
jgi:hypothetical protein